jgi:hypothetical protein
MRKRLVPRRTRCSRSRRDVEAGASWVAAPARRQAAVSNIASESSKASQLKRSRSVERVHARAGWWVGALLRGIVVVGRDDHEVFRSVGAADHTGTDVRRWDRSCDRRSRAGAPAAPASEVRSLGVVRGADRSEGRPGDRRVEPVDQVGSEPPARRDRPLPAEIAPCAREGMTFPPTGAAGHDTEVPVKIRVRDRLPRPLRHVGWAGAPRALQPDLWCPHGHPRTSLR